MSGTGGTGGSRSPSRDVFRAAAAHAGRGSEAGIEAALSIANGWAGVRAARDEGGLDANPATYVAGVFSDRRESPEPPAEGSLAPDPVRAPNWTALRVIVDGIAVRRELGDTVEDEWRLDTVTGTLERTWRQRLPSGVGVSLVTRRWALLDTCCSFLQEVVVGVDRSGTAVRLELALEPDARASAWTWARDAGGALTMRQQTGVARVVVAQRCLGDTERVGDDESTPADVFEWIAAADTSYRFERTVAVETSVWSDTPAERAVERAGTLIAVGGERLVRAQHDAWAARRARAHVEVGGDDALDRALAFASYHLASMAPPPNTAISVGARGLSAEQYRGHVMWDADTYLLPVYALTRPESARSMVAYRYATLDAARAKAARLGCRGALFAWESAATGNEVTPRRDHGARIVTGEQGHHLAADVAYAVCQYASYTGDLECLRQEGVEIVIETARFWADRVDIDERGGHVRHVIGPDEYHEDVDDNAYTNELARWNLRAACSLWTWLAGCDRTRFDELRARLGVGRDEPHRWATIADRIVLRCDRATGVIEQFDGYDALEDVDPSRFPDDGRNLGQVIGVDRVARTKAIKQADVVLMLHLLRHRFDQKVLALNFEHYEPRTDPSGSSLTPSVHALAALRTGRFDLARTWFRRAAAIDLGDEYRGAAEGLHAAACGGLWQALVLGACGLNSRRDALLFDPVLLPEWQDVRVSLVWRGAAIDLSVDHDALELRVGDGDPITAGIGDDVRRLSRGECGRWPHARHHEDVRAASRR